MINLYVKDSSYTHRIYRLLRFSACIAFVPVSYTHLIVNEARLAFMSRSANESFARVAVSGFFMQLDPTVDELTDIKTAVSEAVTNAIVHGYRCLLYTSRCV